mgnify:CR=1 FL=1
MNSYMDYILTQLKSLTAIDSPSGYTKEVTDYLISEYKSLEKCAECAYDWRTDGKKLWNYRLQFYQCVAK